MASWKSDPPKPAKPEYTPVGAPSASPAASSVGPKPAANPAAPYVPAPGSRAALAIGIAHLRNSVMMAVDQATASANKEATLPAATKTFWQKIKDGGFLQNLLNG